MPNRLWTITAENDEGTEIYLSDLFETEPSRAGVAGRAMSRPAGEAIAVAGFP